MQVSRIVATITLVAFVAAPLPAHAKCYTIEKAPLDADCVIMPFGSTRGVWFRLSKAEELRKLTLIVPELKLQIGEYEKTLALRDSQVSDLRGALDAQKKAGDLLKKSNAVLVRDANRAKREREEAEAALNAWYRSPFLWTGVGALLAILVGGVAIGVASE